MRAVVGLAVLQLERNGALIRVHAAVCSKLPDTADIVRGMMLDPGLVACFDSSQTSYIRVVQNLRWVLPTGMSTWSTLAVSMTNIESQRR
jgi:hypothetical protein